MPTRAIPLALAALVAAGIVVYQNREQILEIMERGRQKIKESLTSLADSVAQPKQREQPHGGGYQRSNRDSYYMHRRRSFDQALQKEEEAEGFLSSSAIATGHSRQRSADGLIRQRGFVDDEKQAYNPTDNDVRTSVLFDASANGNGNIPLEALGNRRPATPTHEELSEKELSPPPLPPRRPITPPSYKEATETHIESGYETAQTDQTTLRSNLSTPTVRDAPSLSGQMPHSPFVPPVAIPSTPASVTETSPREVAQPQIETPEISTPSNSVILPPFESTTPFWSIHEWANNTGSNSNPPSAPPSPSLAGSAPEEIDLDNSDVISIGSSAESETSWTEVGSSVSESD